MAVATHPQTGVTMFHASTAALPPYHSRPKEVAFFNVDELGEHVSRTRDGATRMVAPLRSLRVAPSSDGLRLEFPTADRSLRLSYRAAQHLCRRVGVTTAFLGQVSQETAALALNECLGRGAGTEVDEVLLRADAGGTALSLLSTQYAEAWDADVIDAIARPLADAGWFVPPYREPALEELWALQDAEPWHRRNKHMPHPRARPAGPHEVLPKFPGHWGTVEVGEYIRPMGARSSDRDMHLFLVHPDRVVDTSDAMGRKVFRGLTLRHSETGDGPLAIDGFLFDFVCGNYMMWGSRQVFSLRMVHRVSQKTSGFIEEAVERMRVGERELRGETDRLGAMARAAARIELSPDREQRAIEVELMLMQARARRVFSRTFIRNAIRLAGTGRYGAENTVWAVASGLTEQAQRVTSYAAHRAVYDQAAARLVDWAVANA